MSNERTYPDARKRILFTTAVVALLAFTKFAIQFATAGRYGIFREELYYLACARHLAWGYVKPIAETMRKHGRRLWPGRSSSLASVLAYECVRPKAALSITLPRTLHHLFHRIRGLALQKSVQCSSPIWLHL